MAVINVGIGFQGSGGTWSVQGYNYIEDTTAADGTGTITQFDFQCGNVNEGTLDIGLTALSGTSATPRSNVSISSGSDANQLLTFNAPGDFNAPSVVNGDYIQFSSNGINSERDTSNTLAYVSGTTYQSTGFTASLYSGLCCEVSAIGTTGDNNAINGSDWDDVSTVNGIANGNISTINGVTMWDGEILNRREKTRYGIITAGFVSAKRYPTDRVVSYFKALIRLAKNTRYFDMRKAA